MLNSSRARAALSVTLVSVALIGVAGCSSKSVTPTPSGSSSVDSGSPTANPSGSASPSASFASVAPPSGDGIDKLSAGQKQMLTEMEGFIPTLEANPTFKMVLDSPEAMKLNPGSKNALLTLLAASALGDMGVAGWSTVSAGATDGAASGASNPTKDGVTISPALSGTNWQASMASPTGALCVTMPVNAGGAFTVVDGACAPESVTNALKTLSTIGDAAFAAQTPGPPSAPATAK